MKTRREFVASSATIAAAATSLAATASVAPAIAAAAPFPQSELDAVAQAFARPARHRQVFAVARIADGAVTGFMTHALDGYETTLGEGPGSLHPAAVLYGRGVILGLNNHAWKTYRLAEAARRRAETLSSTLTDVNPFGANLGEVVNRGATLLVCDNALNDWATFVVTMMGLDKIAPEDVLADLRRNLLPGAHLVPAGVVAINAAQEAKFTFFAASV